MLHNGVPICSQHPGTPWEAIRRRTAYPRRGSFTPRGSLGLPPLPATSSEQIPLKSNDFSDSTYTLGLWLDRGITP